MLVVYKDLASKNIDVSVLLHCNERVKN